jgi:hypothetical protein
MDGSCKNGQNRIDKDAKGDDTHGGSPSPIQWSG